MANSMVKLIRYRIFENGSLRLDYNNGQRFWVKLDENSGRIVTRFKKDTISKVQHPGIWLGTDYHTGIHYILHNHYLQRGAHIASFDDYAVGQKVSWDNARCANDRLTVIKKGLDDVMAGRQYSWHEYNCQTFTNSACHNEHRSEDLEKWGVRIFTGMALLFFGGLVVRASR